MVALTIGTINLLDVSSPIKPKRQFRPAKNHLNPSRATSPPQPMI